MGKKWCFQLEEGEHGYKHYQGRISLNEKKRKTTLLKELKKIEELETMHISATSNGGKDNDIYVTKEKSRIAGPWSDKTENVTTYIPRQIRDIELRPWQKLVVDDAEIWNTRTINWVEDKDGNKGKSILKTYIGVHKIGRSLPYTNDYKDMMRMVMATEPCKLYIIDLPRAISKDHLYQFCAGIETLKDGYAYDDRYKFREKYFDCPNIWVFSNKPPDYSLLSNDRWKLWHFNGDNLEIVD